MVSDSVPGKIGSRTMTRVASFGNRWPAAIRPGAGQFPGDGVVAAQSTWYTGPHVNPFLNLRPGGRSPIATIDATMQQPVALQPGSGVLIVTEQKVPPLGGGV